MTHYTLSTYGFPFPVEIRMGFNRTGETVTPGRLCQRDTGLTSTEATGFSRGPATATTAESDGFANYTNVRESQAFGASKGEFAIAMAVIPDNGMGPFLVRGAIQADVVVNAAGAPGVDAQPRTQLGATTAGTGSTKALTGVGGSNKKVLAFMLQTVDDETATDPFEKPYVLFDGIHGFGRS